MTWLDWLVLGIVVGAVLVCCEHRRLTCMFLHSDYTLEKNGRARCAEPGCGREWRL